MAKWQYKIMAADEPTVPVEVLDAAGHEGWELVTILRQEEGAGPVPSMAWCYYFKREAIGG